MFSNGTNLLQFSSYLNLFFSGNRKDDMIPKNNSEIK